ncbi:hypothetical protein P9239_20580 [Caballeronia sp. LZ062]|nr:MULTISPECIES: hypothetical protein [unclassified Caballeronia]MDR5856072.1 hypothetical protein [Caballeronia sp. LZ050]MDR5872743.1 hypothetical protein [Caballeronia sp. LZ062]
MPIIARHRNDARKLARPRRAQPAAQVAAIDIGQADIDEDRVIAILRCQQHRLMTVVSHMRNVPKRNGKVSECIAKTGVIFYKQDVHIGHPGALIRVALEAEASDHEGTQEASHFWHGNGNRVAAAFAKKQRGTEEDGRTFSRFDVIRTSQFPPTPFFRQHQRKRSCRA